MIVQKDGRPVPNYVVRGSIPATGMRVDSAFIRYYGQKEGDEHLDTFEYLDPYAEKHVITTKNLRSLVVSVHIINPHKETYRFLFFSEKTSTDLSGKAKTLKPKQKQELLYSGDLSLKEYNLALPTESEFTYRVWYELQTLEGHIIFMGPEVHYEVLGIPITTKSRSWSPKRDDYVGGLASDDPVRSEGQ